MIQLILDRRSIRAGFDGQQLAPDALDAIVRCGLAAPSSKNAQPWRVHVVTDRAQLAEIAGVVERSPGAGDYVPIDPATGKARPEWPSTVQESADVLRQVSLGLFLENRGRFSGGRQTVAQASAEARADALIGYSFELIGLGAAIENMWLAATSLGFGATFMGDILIAERRIAEILEMSGDLVGVLAIGRTTQSAPAKRLSDDCVVYHPARAGGGSRPAGSPGSRLGNGSARAKPPASP